MSTLPRDILQQPKAAVAEKTLIRCATIISMDPAVGNLVKGDILVTGRTITAVGENLSAEDAFVVNAEGMIAIPGMVDSHRHAWEGQLRRINSNAETLEHYSNATHFSFAKHYRPQDMYVGTLLSALGAIDAGITTVIDNSHNSRTPAHSDASVEALLDAGIRALHASGAPVSGTWDRAHWPGNLARLQEKYFKDPANDLVTLATMANIEPELWAEARRLGIPIVTEFFGEQMGAQLPQLHAQRLLGPDNVFNHCTCLKDEGWEILRDAGVYINVCPRSDAHYGIEDGTFAWDAAIRHGLRPGFSVDNETSYSGDIFMEMRVAYYLERVLRVNARPPRSAGTPQDPLNSHRLLEAATLDGAACAGLQDRIGSLTPGKQADIVLFRTGDINLYPSNNAFGTVVHAAERSNIDTVMVGGRVLKRGGEMCGLDMGKLRAAVDESCEHLFSAVGYTPDVFGTSFPVLANH